MIKLFWNTQNQKKTITKDKEILSREALNLKWGIYHQKNSNIWIQEVLNKIQYETIDSETKLDKDDILLVVDSNPENKEKLYEKFKLICSKIILIHLGDETSPFDLSTTYNHFDYVLRTFCSNKYFKNSKVKCIPIGYKSGISENKKDERKYKWAFTGTPHKSSRHDLLFQFGDINPSFCHRTEKFNTKIISVKEMSEILSMTEFLPCPNGFYHPETYRLYEALQCGCIPIVEDTYKYYDRLFPNNPFVKVGKWADAKLIVKEWNKNKIKDKQKECKIWWSNYKDQLQQLIKTKVS